MHFRETSDPGHEQLLSYMPSAHDLLHACNASQPIYGEARNRTLKHATAIDQCLLDLISSCLSLMCQPGVKASARGSALHLPFLHPITLIYTYTSM